MRINSISADKYQYTTKPSFKAIKITDEAMLDQISRYDRRRLKRYNTREATRLIMQFFTEEAERTIPYILGNDYKQIPSIVIRNSIRSRAKEILKEKPKGIDFEPIIVQYYSTQEYWDNGDNFRRNGIFVEPVFRSVRIDGPYDLDYYSCDFPIPFTISQKYNMDNYDDWEECNAEDVPCNEDLFSEIGEKFRYLTDPEYYEDCSSKVNISYESRALVRELIEKNTELQNILQKIKANALQEKDITNIPEVPPISKLNTGFFCG